MRFLDVQDDTAVTFWIGRDVVDPGVSTAEVADVALSMQARESCVEDELALDSQALSKAIVRGDVNYFWHYVTRAHTPLHGVCASCPSSVPGSGVVLGVPADGLQDKRGTGGAWLGGGGGAGPLELVCVMVMGRVQACPQWGRRTAVLALVRVSGGAGLAATIVVLSGCTRSASAQGVLSSSWRS